MAKKTDDEELKNQSHTEVHVETDSEQSISSDVSADVEELTNDLKRVQAEFINFRRRAEDEKAEVMKFATGRIAREFLTARDSFDAELKHRPKDLDAKWAESIDSIRAQFDKAMANLGVERFESLGQEFDPHKHEAVAHDGDGHIVTEEFQPGYQMGDQVIRPAIVKVGSSDEVKS